MCQCANCNSQSISSGGVNLKRRHFLQQLAVCAAATTFGQLAYADPEPQTVEAFLLSCMDHRMADDVHKYMSARGLENQYDHLVLGGAALGAVHKDFKPWNQTFWEHLKIAVQRHKIRSVILMDHRDCDIYRMALKADSSADPLLEKNIHAKYLRDLAQAITKIYPKLEVEMLLMSLDGTVQTIS